MPTMRIETDRDRCVGAGQCALTAPDVFDSDDQGSVTVLLQQLNEAQFDDIREAADLCSVQAITVRE